MECWFWNIDISKQSYFSEELRKGRLRQGWGYEDKLNLHNLSAKVYANTPLDPQEQEAWDRCHDMLCRIQKGDFVAIKNIPSRDEFALAQITGEYDFQIDSSIGDYGHFLPVEIVTTYHKHSKIVPSPLINALNREQNPIRITYKHHQIVRDLVSMKTTREERKQPEQFKEKIANWRVSLFPHLRDALRANLSPKETERLILEMLRRDGMDVLWSAGPVEQGADLLCDVQLGYGLTSKIAIQVKMHWDEDCDTTGIDQLEQAFSVHGVQAALLVSMADELGENVKSRIKQARKTHNIRAIYGEELYAKLLELIADSSFELT